MKIKLPSSKKFWELDYWIGWDIETNYPLAKNIIEKQYWKPNTPDGWLQIIMEYGPVIISGVGIGMAGNNVGFRHSILLIGASKNIDETFYYLDPLIGYKIMKAPWTMNEIIDPELYFATIFIKEHLSLHCNEYFSIIKYI
ncbi:MAG: hypothetical protein KAH18_04605 [Psychromonas sp.]|nr:hypothetical protein [Psychromonas sp.]